ncbi:hypothetical protein QFA96_26880 (plasmid) [Pseudomonas sp. Ap32]|nr:hypothetical protein QFA96_26880 [Pseudomonas sp. Ap32]
MNLDLPTAEAEALLRHALQHAPDTGDFRENAHLREALATLAQALRQDVPWVPDPT